MPFPQIHDYIEIIKKKQNNKYRLIFYLVAYRRNGNDDSNINRKKVWDTYTNKHNTYIRILYVRRRRDSCLKTYKCYEMDGTGWHRTSAIKKHPSYH